MVWSKPEKVQQLQDKENDGAPVWNRVSGLALEGRQTSGVAAGSVGGLESGSAAAAAGPVDGVAARLAAAGKGTISTGALFSSVPTGAQLSYEAAASQAIAFNKGGDLGKLDTRLSALYLAQSNTGSALASYTNSVQQFAQAFSSDGKFVLVDAIAKDGDGAALLAGMQKLGISHGSSFGAVASAFVPVDHLGEFAAISNLRTARQSAMISHAGLVTTQADTAQRSDIAREQFGVDGSGTRIGILSDSYNTRGFAGLPHSAADDIASGDLPEGVRVLGDVYLGGTDEGRAMAQIVHDIAPGAGIDFATAFYGEASFANYILELAKAGDKVIVDDITYFGELYYQNGIIGQAVNAVAAQGVSYFTSAGNNGTSGYEGLWSDGGTQTVLNQQYQLMDFGNGQTYIEVTRPAGAGIVLQWDQPGASAGGVGASSDIDLFVTDENGNVVADSSSQNIGGDPVEIIAAPSNATQTFRIMVGLKEGAPPGRIKLFMVGGNGTLQKLDSNINNSTLTGHHGAEGAIAVGAAGYFNTPAFGADTPVSETFSSSGSQTILYDDTGALRPVPHIGNVAFVAPDGGNTTFFGSDFESDGFPNFFGTSAAAPAAAAAAAILLQANPSLTREDLRILFQQSALDMDDTTTDGFDTGLDRQTGAGLIRVDQALSDVVSRTIRYDDKAVLSGTSQSERIFGSALDNTINANDGDDTVSGGVGADAIFGGAGNDILYGNQNDDALHGGEGNDVLYGGQDNDTLYGDAGNDTLVGGRGNDRMFGGFGDDLFISGPGDDLLDGSVGYDTADYSGAASALDVNLALGFANQTGSQDTLVSIENIVGSDFGDSLYGSEENNVIFGGRGTDVIFGDVGDDIIDGGVGGEIAYADTVSRPDIIKPASIANISMATALALNTAADGDFDTNYDPNITLAFEIPHATVHASASGQGYEYYRFTAEAGTRGIFDIDNSQAPDRSGLPTALFLLDANGNPIAAESRPTTDPGSEDFGSPLLDITFSAGGTYYLFVQQLGSSVIDRGSTYDLNVSLSSAGTVKTGTFTDGPDRLFGGIGNDTVAYGSAIAGVTVDLNLADGATIQFTGGGGNDILDNFENITGSSFGDTLSGNAAANVLKGAEGADTLRGREGADTLFGNEGNDVLFGNQGDDTLYGDQDNDTLYGGQGNDTLYGNQGNDLLQGGLGADTLTGGAGADVFRYVKVGDSTVAETDTITDFEAGIDKVDLRTIRAGASDSFTITQTLGDTLISVDLGGDGTADMQIRLSGITDFSASDIDWGEASSSSAAAMPFSGTNDVRQLPGMIAASYTADQNRFTPNASIA